MLGTETIPPHSRTRTVPGVGLRPHQNHKILSESRMTADCVSAAGAAFQCAFRSRRHSASIVAPAKSALAQDLGNTLPRTSVPKGRHCSLLLLAMQDPGELRAQPGPFMPNQRVRPHRHRYGTFCIVA